MTQDPRRRRSEAGLIGQARQPHSPRPNDPRERRAAAMRSTDQIAGEYLRVDPNGRMTLDFDGLYRAIKARFDAEAGA